MSGDADHNAGGVHRYEGWRGSLRVLREVMAETPEMLREEAEITVSKLRNEGTVDGERCGLAGCEKSGVSMVENPKKYRDSIPMCRRHWLSITAIKLVVLAAAYGTLAAVAVLYLILVFSL